MRRWLAGTISLAALAGGWIGGQRAPARVPDPTTLVAARPQWTPSSVCPIEDCSRRAMPPPQPIRPPTAVTAPRLPAPPTAAPLYPLPVDTSGWQQAGFVAHAFGSPPDGTTYTNSLAAFERSYADGFRVFESDFVRLADGNVILSHDRFEQRFELPAGTHFTDLTTRDMLGRSLDGRTPLLFGSNYVAIVRDHPDATFVLDTKDDHVAIARWLVRHMSPDELDRLRPHVFSQEQIDGLRRLYPWKGFVIATYTWGDDPRTIEAKAVELASRNHIETLMIRPSLFTDQVRDALFAAGVRYIFLHSFSDPEQMTTWRAKGVGVYSNGWIEGMPVATATPGP